MRGEFERLVSGDLPAGWQDAMAAFRKRLVAEKPERATRESSGAALEALTAAVPEMIGGSADLTGSVNTFVKNMASIAPGSYDGRYIHYGIREHGMAAAMNGMVLHGGVIPYAGTFLIFSDYLRPSLRLAALMGIRVIHVLTHDSIGLGEDGPTHQPVEHLASLRAMPNLYVFRPADAVETAECWEAALQATGTPSAMSLTRQKVPALRQDDAYRASVLGEGTVRIAVEAGVKFGWERYIGLEGGFVGMDSFGASAPAPDLYKHFGITAQHVADAARARL